VDVDVLVCVDAIVDVDVLVHVLVLVDVDVDGLFSGRSRL